LFPINAFSHSLYREVVLTSVTIRENLRLISWR
jgi:hypothetical protein